MELLYRLVQGVEITCDNLQVRANGKDGLEVTAQVQDQKAVEDLLQLATGLQETEIRTTETMALAGIFYTIEHWSRLGLVEHVAMAEGKELAIIRPVDRMFTLRDSEPPDDARLSPCVYLRPQEARWTLCLADNSNQVEILDQRCMQWLFEIAVGGPLADSAEPLRAILWRYGFLIPPQQERLSDQCWEFHDTLFHHATRRSNRRFGGTYRFRGRFEPPAAIKDSMSRESVALPTLEPSQPQAGSLQAVMDARRSNRNHDDDNPISLHQLAEFLGRCFRSRLRPTGSEQELLERPYPAGGSIHELEFYLAVRLCEGLDSGLYHYEGSQHQLDCIGAAAAAEPFVRKAATSWGNAKSLPHIVVICASRFPRLAWKYERMAYRLTLLNAGVTLELMYLVATDLGLGGTALGVGDSEAFTRITGLNPQEECAVAEFALGSVA